MAVTLTETIQLFNCCFLYYRCKLNILDKNKFKHKDFSSVNYSNANCFFNNFGLDLVSEKIHYVGLEILLASGLYYFKSGLELATRGRHDVIVWVLIMCRYGLCRKMFTTRQIEIPLLKKKKEKKQTKYIIINHVQHKIRLNLHIFLFFPLRLS